MLHQLPQSGSEAAVARSFSRRVRHLDLYAPLQGEPADATGYPASAVTFPRGHNHRRAVRVL